jgi:hypothetical protein
MHIARVLGDLKATACLRQKKTAPGLQHLVKKSGQIDGGGSILAWEERLFVSADESVKKRSEGFDIRGGPVLDDTLNNGELLSLDFRNQLPPERCDNDHDAPSVSLGGFAAQDAARDHFGNDAASSGGIDAQNFGDRTNSHFAGRFSSSHCVKNVEVREFEARCNVLNRESANQASADQQAHPRHNLTDMHDVFMVALIVGFTFMCRHGARHIFEHTNMQMAL